MDNLTTVVATKKCLLCKAETRENKDYCTEHIEESPYVKGLLNLLAGHEAEQAAILAKQMTTKEILLTTTCKDVESTVERLTEPITVEDLATELGFSEDVTEECVMALWKAGRANLVKTRPNPASEERIIVVMPNKEGGE